MRTLFNDEAIEFGLCEEADCQFFTFKENVMSQVAEGTIEEACQLEEVSVKKLLEFLTY